MAYGQTNAKISEMDVDAALSSSSTNPVQNKAIHISALVNAASAARPADADMIPFGTSGGESKKVRLDSLLAIRTGTLAYGASVTLAPVPRVVFVSLVDRCSPSGTWCFSRLSEMAFLLPGETADMGQRTNNSGSRTYTYDLSVSLSEGGVLANLSGDPEPVFHYLAIL